MESKKGTTRHTTLFGSFVPQSYDNIYRAPSTLYEWFVNAFIVIQRKEQGIVSKEVLKKVLMPNDES